MPNLRNEPSDKSKALDFVVIGAAKSGTTTLFELTKNHPNIEMPKEKEVPFFSENELYNKGLPWYMDTYFQGGSKNKKRGTVTPQYMIGKESINPKIVAKRIYEHNPDTKIIALLRSPVERAYSHYRMLYQRGVITKSFDSVVSEILTGRDHSDPRYKNIKPGNAFLFGSEYGRILSYYYDLFPKNQILIFYTDELKSHPESVLEKFFKFIDVDSSYRPASLGEEFRKGGSKAKIKILTPGFLYKIPFVKRTWNRAVPYPIRKRVEYSINLWNIKANDGSSGAQEETRKKLLSFYSRDLEKLERLTQQKTPWISN